MKQDENKIRLTLQNCDEPTVATAKEMCRRINQTVGVSCRAYVGKQIQGRATRNISVIITCDSPAIKAAVERVIESSIQSQALITEGEA